MNKYYKNICEHLNDSINPNLGLINKLAKLDVEPAKLINALISLSFDTTTKEYKEIYVAKKKNEAKIPEQKRKASNETSKKYIYAHLNIGKKELLRPQILVSLAGRVAGVRKENIGDIVIRKSGTNIEITKQAYNYLMKLEGKEYNGTRIHIKKVKSLESEKD